MQSYYFKLTKRIAWAFVLLGVVIAAAGAVGFHYLEAVRLYQLQFEDEWEEYQRMVCAEDILKEISMDISAWEADLVPVTDLKSKSGELTQLLNSWARSEKDEEHQANFAAHEQQEAKLLNPARQAFFVLTSDIAMLPPKPTTVTTISLIHSLDQLKHASQPLRQFYFESIQDSLASAQKLRYKAQRGTVYFIIIVALLVLTISIFSIKVLKRQAKQLMEQERQIASVELVQHLAHEIRNPLGIIKSAASVIAQRSKGDVAELASDISLEVVRVDGLLMDLLHLRRGDTKPKVPTDIGAIALKVVSLAASKIQTAGLKVIVVNKAQGVLCPCQPDAIKQVLMNLLFNAIEASLNEGTIEITTELVGREYILQVKDYGCGIGQEQKDKIFDLMYTTKPYGFGIGLTVVKNIVQDHHGRIEVNNAKPCGTIFTIYLPMKA